MPDPRRVNECSAADLVALLVEDGVPLREVARRAVVDPGMVHRIKAGMRTNETHWRSLARLAVERGVVRWPANPRRRAKPTNNRE